jgi:serine/threonine-protein kinase
MRFLWRGLWLIFYAGVLIGVLGLTSYVSFSLFVRSGSMAAPELIGLSAIEAQSVLEQRGLEMRHAQEEDRYDELVEVGAVVQQDPAPGSSVKQGGKVTVFLSLGPRRLEIPDVRGQRLQSAVATLAAAGIAVEDRARVYWPHGEAEQVVAQYPIPGFAGTGVQAVDLLVAIDDPASVFVMPDLVTLRAENARRALEAKGFHFGSVKFEAYEGVEAGVILRHTPLPGHPLRRSDWITLVVATGDDPRVLRTSRP